jgi:hypothetical protein
VQGTPLAGEVSKDAEALKTIEKPTESLENQNVIDGKEEEDYVMVDHEDVQTEGRIETELPHQDPISQDDKPGDRDDVREEERPGEEQTKAGEAKSERPVVEVTAEFLELMEGFCMAAAQEFPTDVVDFACRYFQRIYKRRDALRKYSIEVSDLALFSDVNWIGNI